MKRMLAVIATCLLAVGSAALAEENHDHAAKAAQPHEHMKKMREQMARIRAATDPKEKERLMNEHLKTMEESMGRMQGMMRCANM